MTTATPTPTAPTVYRGHRFEPGPRGTVRVYGPRGDHRGNFVSAAAARQWLDVFNLLAPRSIPDRRTPRS